MPVRFVSFDMEGTLVDHGFSNRVWEQAIPSLYARRHGGSFEEASRRVHEQYAEIGEGRPEWYDVGYWWRRLDLPGDWRTVIRESRDACFVYPEVGGVLDRMVSHYPLVVSSNTIRPFLQVQLECVGRRFDRVFSAPSDFGSVKNTPAFYGRVCEELGITPEELAHVGDHPDFDCKAPRRIGVHAYLLDRSGKAGGPEVVRSLAEFEGKLGEA